MRVFNRIIITINKTLLQNTNNSLSLRSALNYE